MLKLALLKWYQQLKIRHLLGSLLGLLSLIAIAAISWNAMQVIQQKQEASQMGFVYRFTELTLRINKESAIERGLTASFLTSQQPPDSDFLQQLARQRHQVDEEFGQLLSLLEQQGHPRNTANNIPFIPRLHELHERLLELRQFVDHNAHAVRQLKARRASPVLVRWLHDITDIINQVAGIRHEFVAVNTQQQQTYRYNPLLTSLLYNLTEHIGLERAILSAQINQGRPLNPSDVETFGQFLDIIKKNTAELNTVLGYFPQDDTIRQAQRTLGVWLEQTYFQTRGRVINAGQAGEDYPISERQWFSTASETIELAFALQRAISEHVHSDIEAFEQRAQQTVLALVITIGLVLLALLGILFVTTQRIFRPLHLLERAAGTMARGELNQPLLIHSGDEFGQLAQTFETMRRNILSDITRRTETENQLRKLSKIIEQNHSSIIITDREGFTEYVNPCFERVSGYSKEEVVGNKFNLVRSEQTLDKTYASIWETIKAGRIWEGELVNRKKSGELYWDWISISPILDDEGEISHFVSIQHDITRHKQLEQDLNFLEYYDPLTNLANRNLLEKHFNETRVASLNRNRKLALLLLDMDRFKLVNDSLGHRAGNRILIEIAARLSAIAGPNITVSRYYGDEFIILLSDIQSTEEVERFLNRHLEHITAAVHLDAISVPLALSAGIAMCPEDGDTLEILLSHADTAMHQAKLPGQNKYQFFTPGLNEQTARRFTLEIDLRRALEQHQFELYYQPQVSLTNGRIIGAEALLRWHHPAQGLINPLEFIPICEETGLIVPLGEWVIEQACHQTLQWRRMGLPDFTTAVNVSIRQLEKPDFIARLRQMIQRLTIIPASIEFEITESVMMEKPEEIAATLKQIKKLGFNLALDDFGTGHSSLAYLKQLPFDKLKIDRSFIRELTINPDDAMIANTIGAMAHTLKLAVIAEGVETRAQATYLKRNNCDQIQGYLISPPVPASDFEAGFIRQQLDYLDLFTHKRNGTTLLLIDNDADVLDALQNLFKHKGYHVLPTRHSHAAFTLLAENHVDIVITDQQMSDTDGINFLTRVRDIYPEVARILLTGHTAVTSVIEAVNSGAIHKYHLKPWDDKALLNSVETLLEAKSGTNSQRKLT